MFGEFGDKMMDLIKQLRDYKPYNIVFLAHDTIDKDEHSRRFTGIDIVGKSSRKVVGLLDEVLYYKVFEDEKGNEQRWLLTRKHDNILAGDRSVRISD